MNNILNFEEEKIELELLGKLNNLLNNFNEVDELIGSLPQKTSHIELLRSDLEHLLEDKEMGSIGYKNIAKELEKVRIQRRHLKKAYEISKVFQENRTKLLFPEKRALIRTAIETKFEELQTTYNYRLLNAENIKELLGMDKVIPQTKQKEIKEETNKRKIYKHFPFTKEELDSLFKEGMSVREIASKYDLAIQSVYDYKKKYNLRTNKEIENPINKTFNREISKDEFMMLYNTRMKQKDMAKHFSCSPSYISYLKKKYLNN